METPHIQQLEITENFQWEHYVHLMEDCLLLKLEDAKRQLDQPDLTDSQRYSLGEYMNSLEKARWEKRIRECETRLAEVSRIHNYQRDAVLQEEPWFQMALERLRHYGRSTDQDAAEWLEQIVTQLSNDCDRIHDLFQSLPFHLINTSKTWNGIAEHLMKMSAVTAEMRYALQQTVPMAYAALFVAVLHITKSDPWDTFGCVLVVNPLDMNGGQLRMELRSLEFKDGRMFYKQTEHRVQLPQRIVEVLCRLVKYMSPDVTMCVRPYNPPL